MLGGRRAMTHKLIIPLKCIKNEVMDPFFENVKSFTLLLDTSGLMEPDPRAVEMLQRVKAVD